MASYHNALRGTGADAGKKILLTPNRLASMKNLPARFKDSPLQEKLSEVRGEETAIALSLKRHPIGTKGKRGYYYDTVGKKGSYNVMRDDTHNFTITNSETNAKYKGIGKVVHGLYKIYRILRTGKLIEISNITLGNLGSKDED
jgi:hypothetical protein